MRAGVLVVRSREERTTKNYEDRRIPIATELVALLKRHPRRLGSEYVFPAKDGKTPLAEVRKALSGAASRAGLERFICTSSDTPFARRCYVARPKSA